MCDSSNESPLYLVVNRLPLITFSRTLAFVHGVLTVTGRSGRSLSCRSSLPGLNSATYFFVIAYVDVTPPPKVFTKFA